MIRVLNPAIFNQVLLFSHAEADTVGPNYPTLQDSTYQPSLAVVIGILAIMFVITTVLVAFAKLCPGSGSARLTNRAAHLLGSSRRFSGLDKAVIESLPFFRFSSLKGSKDGLECAVCLSRFEDSEALRLLPKCRHAFHVGCIDHLLEKHSSCPLCRHMVSSDDLKLIACSNSLRFQRNDALELCVQREEESRGPSARFSSGNSCRKIGGEKEETLAQNDAEPDRRALHKLSHKIVVSGFVFNNRWSDLSSSDLLFLSSEMLNDMASRRFSSAESNDNSSLTKAATFKHETDRKILLENKIGVISTAPIFNPVTVSVSSSRPAMNSGDHRSASEITAFSRYAYFDANNRITGSFEHIEKEERVRRVWLRIAKRTVQWFANKERSQSSHGTQRQNIEV